MKQKKALQALRNWLFAKMVAILINGDWIIVMKNSPGSARIRENSWSGLTDFKNKTIFLDDSDNDIISTLCHELGHVVFQDFLLEEARRSAKMEVRKLKGRDKMMKWAEQQIVEWEECFFGSLSKEQRGILEMFIDEARKGS